MCRMPDIQANVKPFSTWRGPTNRTWTDDLPIGIVQGSLRNSNHLKAHSRIKMHPMWPHSAVSGHRSDTKISVQLPRARLAILAAEELAGRTGATRKPAARAWSGERLDCTCPQFSLYRRLTAEARFAWRCHALKWFVAHFIVCNWLKTWRREWDSNARPNVV